MGPEETASAQVFAGEYNRSRVPLPPGGGSSGVLTITGLGVQRLLVVGALLEKQYHRERLAGARIADPTGAFELFLEPGSDAAASGLEEMETPCFTAMYGTARLFRCGRDTKPVVIPLVIAPAGREERDSWVRRTASLTIRRIEEVRDVLRYGQGTPGAVAAVKHYNPSRDALREIALLVRQALDSLEVRRGETEVAGDRKERVLRMLASFAEGEPVRVEELLGRAEAEGLGRAEAEAAIFALLAEGECYSPRKGWIRRV